MKTLSPFVRIVLGALSACVVVFGIIAMVVKPMMRGRSSWDGTMLGPLAIIAGSVVLIVVLLFPGRLSSNTRDSRSRH